MFKKVTEAVINYKTIAESLYHKHMKNVQKINAEYIGVRFTTETEAEDNRYIAEIGEVRRSCSAIVNKACDNLIAHVREKMADIDVVALNEIRALKETGLGLSNDDLQVFLDKYTASGNYWAMRYMIDLCRQQGHKKELYDFTLADNLNVIEQARADALFMISNFESDNVEMQDAVIKVTLGRIGANPEVHFLEFEQKFNANPVCTTSGYIRDVKDGLLERYKKLDGDLEGKKELGKEILTNLWEEYIDGVRPLMYAVSLAQ